MAAHFRLIALLLCASTAHAACELPAEAPRAASAADAGAAAGADAPRLTLLSLVDAAAQRSKAVGAAALLADAARADLDETRAAALPLATLGTQIGAGGAQGDGAAMRSSAQLRPTLSLNAPLFDAGRQQHLNRWRESLAEAARLGQLGAAEQVSLQTVSLALDRSRYQLHLRVYNQYARTVCGLVESLEQIVAADRGRASELVQARKTQQQVDLLRSQARSQLRLTELKLARLVGRELPDPGGLSVLLMDLPDLEPLQARAAQATEIAQLSAQGDAAEQMAAATEAGHKPQAGWVLAASRNLAGDRAANWQAGIQVSVPLLNPGAAPAARAATLRAAAARLQRDDALEALRSRLAEVHEQAQAAATRGRDVARVLADSQRVRDDTQMMWQQLGRRSLFDVMSAEGDHYTLRVAYADALHDSQQSVALLWSLAGGVTQPLR